MEKMMKKAANKIGKIEAKIDKKKKEIVKAEAKTKKKVSDVVEKIEHNAADLKRDIKKAVKR